jgi:D-alanyl-D-alanine carboxypeptidase
MIDRARKDYVQLSFLYVLAVLAVLFLSTLSESPSSSTTGIAVSPYISTYASSSLFTTIAFSNVQIKGKAYVVYDLTLDKVIASKNADQVLPLASVTKVMTAFTARTHSDKDALITIEPGSIDGGYDLGLKKGQMWHLNEYLCISVHLSYKCRPPADCVCNFKGCVI